MGIKKFKTFVVKNRTGNDQKWFQLDAEGKTLGKIAVDAANILRGKNKAEFTSHVDCGDYLVVINAEKISFSGNNKAKDKKYYSHSGFANGLKEESLESILEKKPEKAIKLAVKGMLPKNKLRAVFMRKLKIYAGNEHPHGAQKLTVL